MQPILLENDDKCNLNEISLGIPNQLQNNLFFSKINLNGKPLIIQTGECHTTSGIKSTQYKTYCDLVYCMHEKVSSFFDELETNIKSILIENKYDWFEEKITQDDVDDAFNETVHFHKQGVRLRSHIQKDKISDEYILNCYDDNHNKIPIEYFEKGCSFIPIVEIVGLKFSDKSFNIEVRLLQVLLTSSQQDNSLSLFNLPSEKPILANINDNDHTLSELDSDFNRSYITSEVTNQLIPENTDNAVTEVNSDISLKDLQNDNDNNIKFHEDDTLSENDNQYEDDILHEDGTLRENDSHSTSVTNNIDKTDFESNNINSNDIKEVNLSPKYLNDNPIKLKTHSDIYEEIWKMYREEAFKIRRQNVLVYLKSKNIHSTFLINEV